MKKYKDYRSAIQKGYWDGNMKYCVDITEKWLGIKKKITNNVIIPNNCKFVKYKGKKYYVIIII